MRGPRGAEPTPAGRTLAHHARLVLAQMDRMRGDLDQYGQGLKGLVRVQCNTTALSEHLPPVLGEFLQRHPRVSVDLEERPSHEIADALRAGTCDIGVLADSADLGGLRVAVFRHDPLCLIVPSGMRWPRAASSRWPMRRARISSGWSKAAPCRSTSRSTRAAMARACPTACGCAVSTRSAGWWARAWAWRSCRAAAVRHGRSAGFRRLDLSDDWAARDLVLCVRGDLPAYAEELVAHALRGAPGATRSEAAPASVE